MKLKYIPLLAILLIATVFISGCVQQQTTTSSGTGQEQVTQQKQIPEVIPEKQPICTPNWECSAWSECNQSGRQTRICTDKNNCGVAGNKPTESQSCTPKVRNDCPDFSSLSDRVSCQGESCYFAVLNDYGSGKVVEYELYVPDRFYPSSAINVRCRKGIEKGENANYFYCKGMYTIIKEVDSAGNILNSKEPSVKLVVYNSKIIDSICE